MVRWRVQGDDGRVVAVDTTGNGKIILELRRGRGPFRRSRRFKTDCQGIADLRTKLAAAICVAAYEVPVRKASS